MRRCEREANIEYHNKIIRAAWELYLKRENDDYKRTGSNATITSWERTGMEPFNPRCEGWTQGIETFGAKDKMMNKIENNTLHYEVKVRSDAKESELSEKEREQLRADGMDVSTTNCLEIASLRANQLLSKWREFGKTGQEPGEMAETDVEKTVMKLFEFVSNRQINKPETAIKITKLTYPDDDEGVVKETPGSVTRTLGETGEEKWVLFLRGEGMQTVTRAQLMDLKMYCLHIPAEHLNEKERKEKQRRNTRMSVRERLHYENEVKDTLKEEWEHDMMAEHAKMKLGFYDKFEFFLELAREIKKPYTRKYTYESSQTNK
eukprot:scaffold247981_cov23-Attheya_sp.AAC.1